MQDRIASFQQYIVSFFFEGFQGRQLATVRSARKQSELIDYIEEIGGRSDGNWFKFSNESDFHKAIIRTRELGGIVYDLPVKSGL